MTFMKQCPRCSADITYKMKKCDKCGLPLDSVDFSDEIEEQKRLEAEQKQQKKQSKKDDKRAKKAAKKQERKERRERESVSDTDFSKFATNSESNGEPEYEIKKGFFGDIKKRKKKQLNPKFELDENGEFNIDTKDVEIVGEETGKLIEDQYTRSYSVKKARGDYRPPKIKWWEIYKLADRAFARRKIKKEVNKAAKIKPGFIKKTKLMLLSIFLGWCGAHNFYAKNYKKGWTQVVSLFVWFGVIFGSAKWPFLKNIEISVGGFAGFIDCFIWFGDMINIAFNSFKYRIQKEGFIFALNIETRAKLGEKYIDLDLYKKPWWVRAKVWLQKKKRGYQEWKHDRRQRLIEREKAKLAAREEQAKIDEEIARHDAMEDAEIAKAKQSKYVVDEKTISELKSFGDNDTKVLKAETKTEAKADEKTEEPKEKKTSKPKTAKAKFTSKTGAKKTGSKNTTKKK